MSWCKHKATLSGGGGNILKVKYGMRTFPDPLSWVAHLVAKVPPSLPPSLSSPLPSFHLSHLSLLSHSLFLPPSPSPSLSFSIARLFAGFLLLLLLQLPPPLLRTIESECVFRK